MMDLVEKWTNHLVGMNDFIKPENIKKIATLNIDSHKTIHNGVYDGSEINRG